MWGAHLWGVLLKKSPETWQDQQVWVQTEMSVCLGPRREQIIRLQGQVDKYYAGLKEAAEERRRRLENMCHLFQLKREVEDLEQWIAERDVAASSQELGQDLDHVTVSPLACAWWWRW